MHIRRRPNSTLGLFIARTIAAQTHFLACIAAVVGLIFLVRFAIAKSQLGHVWACAIFGATAILVFATSAIYHFLHDGFHVSSRLERLLEDFDHFAIYLFIAGTYTPFLLNAVSEPWTTVLLIAIWSVAIIGILYTRFKSKLPSWAQHRFVYTGLFVLMGWTILVRIGEIVTRLSSTGLRLLIAGGISYSIGAVVYATRRPRLFVGVFGFHELWHVMVVLGFMFHYFMIASFYRAM